MVVSAAVGAPVPLPELTAPMAPEPLTPDVSTPLKLTTVTDAGAALVSVTVTDVLVSGESANARQISEDPGWTSVRATGSHVSPPPLTLATVVCPK